eukprot:2972654-Prymnesium_polylepis.1
MRAAMAVSAASRRAVPGCAAAAGRRCSGWTTRTRARPRAAPMSRSRRLSLRVRAAARPAASARAACAFSSA